MTGGSRGNPSVELKYVGGEMKGGSVRGGPMSVTLIVGVCFFHATMPKIGTKIATNSIRRTQYVFTLDAVLSFD